MTPELQARIVRWSVWTVIAVVALLVLPVVVVSATTPGCESCHVSGEVPLTMVDGPHATLDDGCVTCHVGESLTDRVIFGYYQTYGMMVPVLSTADSSISRVPDRACRSCHAEDISAVTVSGGLRIAHEFCTEGSTCTDCHSTVVHGESIKWPSTYHMDYCLRCHESKQVSSSCDTCHSGKLDKARPTTGPWAVTHGKDWKSTHGMGDMKTCSACHPVDYCVRCHGAGVPHDERFFINHGTLSQSESAKCMECHTDRSFCDDCHGFDMPHTKQFTKDHSALVAEQGDRDCMNCHIRKDCENCHTKHIHPGGAIDLNPPKVGG